MYYCIWSNIALEWRMSMKKRCFKRAIALMIICALAFGIFEGPIRAKASQNDSIKNEGKSCEYQIDGEEIVNQFRVETENNSYIEYKITSKSVYCTYYEYIGLDNQGKAKYKTTDSKTDIIEEIDDDDTGEQKESATYVVRDNTSSGEGPLYWQKNVKDKLKHNYYYQRGVRGKSIYFRIGAEQSFLIEYSKLDEKGQLDVDKFTNQIDKVNKEIMQCFMVAVGAVMVAISAIIASYTVVGATVCGTIVADVLKQCGVHLMNISAASFGAMVFNLYDDYCDVDKLFTNAATYGTVFIQE